MSSSSVSLSLSSSLHCPGVTLMSSMALSPLQWFPIMFSMIICKTKQIKPVDLVKDTKNPSSAKIIVTNYYITHCHSRKSRGKGGKLNNEKNKKLDLQKISSFDFELKMVKKFILKKTDLK